MTLDFRQRLLATTLFVGASLIAAPAFAQAPVVDQPDPNGPNNPPDTSAVTEAPQTVAPVEGTVVPSTNAEGETVESSQDIVVTGSRIPQPNLESASPVTVVTAQEVKITGTTRTEDLINSLPQAFAAQGSNVSNGSTGTATVDLRDLGPRRTLVLVNGRRLMPGDPRSPTPDINFVPSALIKRVDVLTGGASSVYGADAVAGVVNFIMDTNFRGLRIDAQASGFMHSNDMEQGLQNSNIAQGYHPPQGTSFNGLAMDVAAAFGAGFDDGRGSVMGYATYRKQNSVLQSTRDYSYCTLTARAQRDTGTPPRDFNCGGSATSAAGSFFTNVGIFHVEGNQFVSGQVPFNFAPYNYFQRPDERYTLGVFADYEISEVAKPYLEAMFMDDESDAQIAPSGNFFNTTTLNCDNPLLSAQQLAIVCAPENLVGFAEDDPDTPEDESSAPTVFTDANGNTYNKAIVYIARRNVEGGGRDDDLNHTAYRLVGGVRGDLHRGLSYDAYYQYGTTKLTQTYFNDFSVTRIKRALDVVDDGTGTPVCRSVLDGTDANCVPWNIFTTGGVNQAALAYLQTPGFSRGNVREQIANVNFTILGGEYGIQMPWTDRGVGVNVGAEYRKEALDFSVDQAFETGDLAGQGGPTIGVSGAFDVRDLFAEVDVPIVNDSFIYELSLNAGYRYSRYKVANNSFSTDTYKIAGEFAPVKDIRFRGSYNRAVRAPNVVELFSAQSIGLAGNTDPCANDPVTGVPTASLSQCQNTGVSAAQYGNINANPANQYNALFGGNTELAPEKADTYTVGAVVQPRFLPGFAATVDYFDIKVTGLVSAGAGFATIMNQCLTSGQLCEFIHRNAGNGSLWLSPNGFIDLRNTNLGGLRTRGLDLQASYARQIGGYGSLNLAFVGSRVLELTVNPLLDTEYDCTGFYGATCGTPVPKWRHKFRAGFTFPSGIGVSAAWRYFSGVTNDTLSDDADLNGTGDPFSNPGDARLNSRSYFDLAFQARLAERYNFRLGANNIFDTDPPVAGGATVGPPFGNGNTFPQVYDSLGRYIFAGVTVDF